MTEDRADLSAGGPRWICRYCGGGFPKPFVAQGKTVCPWCGKRLAKMFTASKEQEKRLWRWYDVE